MGQQSEAESELAALIVDALNLPDVDPASIAPEAPLFGDGLGLDSIDALEIAMVVGKKYGVELRSDDENNAEIFANLRNLANYIQTNRTK